MRKSGHTILVTGGTSGIGLALSRRFVEYGNTVIVVGRSAEKLHRIQQGVPQIKTLQCELSDRRERLQLVEKVQEQYGDLSVIVNNAGIQYNYHLLEERTPPIAEEIEVNLTAPIELCVHFLPLLAARDEAAIVNITSGLALIPKTSAPVYCATKAGLHLYSKALRNQLEGTSIRVFDVLPALTDTDMTRGRGRNKMTPEALVDEFLPAYFRNQGEIPIGPVKLLQWLLRLSPRMADRIFKNS